VFDDGGDMTHVLLRKFPALSAMCKGIVEETVTGVHRLYQRCKQADKTKQLPCAAMNTHDAVVKVSLLSRKSGSI
jgi:adenosylhomocysteinase